MFQTLHAINNLFADKMLLYINESLLYVFLCVRYFSSDYQLIDTKYEQKANLTDQLNRLHFGLIYFLIKWNYGEWNRSWS